MRKIIAILSVVLIMTGLLFVNASAAGDVTVGSVHFDAVINTDGTVDVTEKWSIEYLETGDGFTRWIDLYDSKNSNSMTDLEKFDSVSDIVVSVNGKEIAESQSGNNTFRYGQSADGRSFNIEIDSPSADEVKEYVITYKLNGAVKKNGKQAEFAYVFLGKTFEFVSNNVSATVSFPETVSAEDIVIDENSTGLLSGNKVEYSPGRVYDTFRINVSCNSDIFDENALVKYSAFKESVKKAGAVILDVLYWLVIAAIVLAIVILALFSDRIKRSSIEKQAKKSIDADITSVDASISPCAAYKMVKPYSRINPKASSEKVVSLFALAILECIEKGYIVAADDVLMVGTPSENVPVYIMSVLNFLKTFSEKRGNRYIIDDSFAEKIQAECANSYDTVVNYLATFYNLIPSVDGKFFKSAENRELYKNVYILRSRIQKERVKVHFDECMRGVLDGEKAGAENIFALPFANGKKVFDCSGNDCAATVARALSEMNEVFVKSK